MTSPYTTLGVSVDATDAAIRQRYLELTRAFPPEQHPERFAAHQQAYEKIRTLKARVQYHLYEAGREDAIETLIEEAQTWIPRQRIGLMALLRLALPPR